MTTAQRLTEAAQYVPKVYDAGHRVGQQEEYDRFWDTYQQNGERRNYKYAFAGAGWTDDVFKPKYHITVNSATYMFASSSIKNLKAIIDRIGIAINFSECTDFTFFLNSSSITDLGEVDTRAAASLANFMFAASNLVNVDQIILKEDGSSVFANTSFQGCAKLENVLFAGSIGKNGLNLKWSTKLSHDSIVSLVNALSGTTSDLTVTLSNTAKEAAFTDEEWAELIEPKANWTIALA